MCRFSLAAHVLPLLTCVLMLGGVHRCSAQATTGTILGRVLDAQSGVVPDATITVQNVATGMTQTAKTGGAGEYSVPALPPGSYTLTASKNGFTQLTRNGLRLEIDQKMRVDLELTIGIVSETLTVTAPTPVLQTETAETGQVIVNRQILDLPLLGRNFLELTRLTAGVSGGAGGNTLNVAVNGQREFANSILVDGVEVSANRNNDTTLRPSVDSVEEFKVLTAGYAAEWGRSSGAVIAIQMKSGTNRLHGSLYEFLRPSGTAARTFFATEPSPLKQNNYGGTLGGPLKKDRTFFFASYEGMRLRDAFSFLDSVPPAGQIQLSNGSADLSGLKDPLTGNPVPIFDPNAYAALSYAQPFPGNVIPASRVSPAGRAILQNFFPAPSAAGVLNGWYNNFVSRQAYVFDSHTASGRLDHQVSDNDRFSAVFHYGSFASNTGDRFAGYIPVSGGGDADYGDREDSRSQSLSISETHLISGRSLNEFRFGYTRYRLDQQSLLDGQSLASQFGLGNVNLPGFPETSGFPVIYLGFGSQTGGSTYKPLSFLDRNYQVADNMVTHQGKHEWKAGLQFRKLNSTPLFSLFPTGFQYYGGPGLSLTSDPNYSYFDANAFYYNGGSDIADLLLGLPYTVNLGQQMTHPATRSWEGSLYIQDMWQVTRALALSYGVRYEYYAPWSEANNAASNFDLSTGKLLLAGLGSNSASLVSPDRNNFGPRLGLAYRMGSRTVLRAGWGMFYSPENDARSDVLTKNYPFAVQQTAFNDIYSGPPFSYTLDAGIARVTPAPVSPGVSALDPAAIRKVTGLAQNVFMVDAQLRTGYSQLYNFTLQRELTPSLTLEAGYVGSVSGSLPYAVGNLNRANRITPALGTIQAQFSEGEAGFNSLQVKASKRFSRNLSFLAAYTFGKNIDNGPAPFNLGHNLNSHNQPQDATQLSLERAVADIDIQHNLMLSYVYELPFGTEQRFLSGLHGLPQMLLGGWRISGIVAKHSGLPVNVVRNPQNAGYEGLRPDIVREPNLPESERTLTHYFDTGAFVKSAFTGAHKLDLGNAGRNLVRGPGLGNIDFSALKEVPVRERFAVQLRFEFFNLTNTPHFANPAGDMAAGNFGSITQTAGNPRIVQFGAKMMF